MQGGGESLSTALRSLGSICIKQHDYPRLLIDLVEVSLSFLFYDSANTFVPRPPIALLYCRCEHYLWEFLFGSVCDSRACVVKVHAVGIGSVRAASVGVGGVRSAVQSVTDFDLPCSSHEILNLESSYVIPPARSIIVH